MIFVILKINWTIINLFIWISHLLTSLLIYLFIYFSYLMALNRKFKLQLHFVLRLYQSTERSQQKGKQLDKPEMIGKIPTTVSNPTQIIFFCTQVICSDQNIQQIIVTCWHKSTIFLLKWFLWALLNIIYYLMSRSLCYTYHTFLAVRCYLMIYCSTGRFSI